MITILNVYPSVAQEKNTNAIFSQLVTIDAIEIRIVKLVAVVKVFALTSLFVYNPLRNWVIPVIKTSSANQVPIAMMVRAKSEH